MENVERLRGTFTDDARDLKLNLQSVLTQGSLEPKHRWGVAVSVAYATGHRELIDAIVADAAEHLDDAVMSDAKAAAALMGMNNVFYRFKHFMAQTDHADDYQIPARLRMNRIAKPKSDKISFELFSLAVSAVHGCELCVTSHEKVVRDGDLSAQQVQDAVRIAAVLHGVATALLLR